MLPECRSNDYLYPTPKFNLKMEQDCQVLAGQNYNDCKEQVFSCLDNIIRASSLIETANSIIRPYLNTCKGQITQEMLTLIMFYHNHRQFNNGKRKDKRQ